MKRTILLALLAASASGETFYMTHLQQYDWQGKLFLGGIGTVRSGYVHHCVDSGGKPRPCTPEDRVSDLVAKHRVALDYSCGDAEFTLTAGEALRPFRVNSVYNLRALFRGDPREMTSSDASDAINHVWPAYIASGLQHSVILEFIDLRRARVLSGPRPVLYQWNNGYDCCLQNSAGADSIASVQGLFPYILPGGGVISGGGYEEPATYRFPARFLLDRIASRDHLVLLTVGGIDRKTTGGYDRQLIMLGETYNSLGPPVTGTIAQRYKLNAPKGVHRELNRLKDYVASCSSSPPARVAGDSDAQADPLDEAKEAVRALRDANPAWWNDWKRTSLEAFTR